MINSTLYTKLSLALLAGTLAAAVYLALQGRWSGAGILVGLAVVGFIFISIPDRLPRLFTFLFTLAGVINAAGYIFDLWKIPVWFDEAVHFYTSFTVIGAAGWLILMDPSKPGEQQPLRFVLSVVLIGLAIGLAWELFEWIVGIIGSPRDTVVDVIMDLLGALAAALFGVWVGKELRKDAAAAEADMR